MFVQLDSARVGALLAGEVVTAEPAAEGGLRLHCIGRGWASMATDDGSPLLIPLSRELRSCMPVFGRYYTATARVPIRNSPAVSSAALGAEAAILPGECLRIERVVLNELAVPKVAIIHEAEANASVGAEAEAVSTTCTITPWGWVSFWSVSDASPLFTMEDTAPSPSRVWGIGGTSGGKGGGLRPPECRPPPPPTLDGSGGLTGFDAEGRIVFGWHEPRTVSRAALALQALGKSPTREKMKVKAAIDASAEALQLSSLSSSSSAEHDNNPASSEHDNNNSRGQQQRTRSGGSSSDRWREQSFISNLNRHSSLVDEKERPCTVSLVRGHVGMDNLSYIRQTFARPANLLGRENGIFF
jgi:hypothetical protein